VHHSANITKNEAALHLTFHCTHDLCHISNMRYPAEFSLALIFEIQAICISLLIFLYFARNPATRLKRQHHSWLALLTMNFIQLLLDLPIAISFFYRGEVWPRSNVFCVWWVWLSFSLDTAALFLLVWIAIERHLLVFHSPTIFQGHGRKWLFRIAPIFICLIWPSIVYFAMIVVSAQCTTVWNFETLLCGPPCYTYTDFYGIYDLVFNVCVPLLLSIVVNMVLVFRVVRGKMSHRALNSWRRYRKMILQFWAISSLHIALWSPVIMVCLVQITVTPSFMADQYTILEHILYYMPLLLPVTCLCAVPKLVKKMMNVIRKRRTNVVPASNLPVASQATAHPDAPQRWK
jgi:hypothetical protein